MPTIARPIARHAAPETAGAVVAAAASGDEAAWNHLVDRYDGLVASRVRAVGGLAHQDYEDAAAATWLRLVDVIASLRHGDAVGGWLATTAYREALRIARTRRRRSAMETELLAEATGAEMDLDVGILRAHLRSVLPDVMRHLSPTGRLVLTAYLWDPGASYHEISVGYGIRIGSIGPIRERVFDKLRVALGECGPCAPAGEV